MATYSDHFGAADAAYEAVRALAHATIRFDHDDEPAATRPEHPEDTYAVLGDVLGIVRCLSQVVQHIGAAHDRHADLARTDDGSAIEGRTQVQAVHAHVHEALLHFERVHTELNAAMSASGRIAWQPPEDLTFSASGPVTAAGPSTTAIETHRATPPPPLFVASARAAAPGGPGL
ncbi:hypothetical protein L1785_22260 [Antribacter sp. KLBMP9083]|uniref:Uncharacterized protein n=1 Tax=Antribacter soli TaxID=2910976 RepID=A0AA41U977_9MICO|nr:hypothetical protein [Antribacter soli]MCF4123688.1 hypothetical protein [Antribacter soli]